MKYQCIVFNYISQDNLGLTWQVFQPSAKETIKVSYTSHYDCTYMIKRWFSICIKYPYRRSLIFIFVFCHIHVQCIQRRLKDLSTKSKMIQWYIVKTRLWYCCFIYQSKWNFYISKCFILCYVFMFSINLELKVQCLLSNKAMVKYFSSN